MQFRENIKIIRAEANHIEYTRKIDNKIYKFIEDVDLGKYNKVLTQKFVFNQTINEFEKISDMTTLIDNTYKKMSTINEDGTREYEILDIQETTNDFPKIKFVDNIKNYGYGDDWVWKEINHVFSVNARDTIATICVSLAGGIGALIGGLAGPFASGALGSGFAYVAGIIVDRNLKAVKTVGKSGFRYQRPNIYTRTSVNVYDLDGKYIGRNSAETGPNYVG